MVRVGVYNRCSTEEEAQINALQIQAAESLEIAENRSEEGWVVVEQYIESESGTSIEKRKEYLRMVADIEAGRFDIIMVKSIDRLARNTKDWYLFLDCLVRNDTRLYLYLENKFYRSDDALVSGIKAILAEEFSKELSAKIKNAHKRRQQKQTGYNITREMFGWDRIAKDVYEVNQEEAEYFYLACHLAEEGCGFRRISNALYEAGARNKNGTRISEVQWRKMLRSERAYGTIILHKEEYDFESKKRKKLPQKEWIYIEQALPPLITKEYHNKLLSVLNERAGKQRKNITRPNNAGKYLLSGKIICGCCGSVYYRTGRAHKGKKENGELWVSQKDRQNMSQKSCQAERKNIWKCAKYLREGNYHQCRETGCSNLKIEEEELLQKIAFFYNEKYDNNILEVCGNEDKILLDDFFCLLRQGLEGANTEKTEALLLKKQEKIRRDKIRLLQKLLDDVISDEDYQRYQIKIEAEEVQLERKITKLQEEKAKQQMVEERLQVILEVVRQKKLFERAVQRMLAEQLEKIYLYPDGTIRIL